MNVTVKDFSEYRIVYFRHTGSYLETRENWNSLIEWVERRNLFKTNPADDPEGKGRCDICIPVK